MSQDALAALAAPFDPKTIQWRVGSTNKRNFEAGKADTRKGQALAYIDARDVMERLDAVVGPSNWTDTYAPMPNGAVSCTISIWFDDRGWVGKTDGAGATGDTSKEAEREMATKGGFSDAFKRAAVKWGVGRYLYSLDAPWVVLNEWWGIPDSEKPKLMKALGTAPSVQALPKKDARALYTELVEAVRATRSVAELDDLVKARKADFEAQPEDWKRHLRGEVSDQKTALRKSAEAAE